MARTFYTAVGHFRRRNDGHGNIYPVVFVNRQEHLLDPQEMAVWTILNWRLLDAGQLEEKYLPMARELQLTEYRTFENCLHRLEVRGLIASGTSDTDIDALYNLLCGLYIVPVSESLPLRIVAFLKMLFQGVPFSKAKHLFTRVPLSAQEAQILGLSKQALLSTAELIKCVDLGVTDLSTGNKIMDALYDDDYTTSDNIVYAMQSASCSTSVTMAVANLLLSRKIIFERV